MCCNVLRTALDKINDYVKQTDTKIYYTQKEKLEQVSGRNAHQVQCITCVSNVTITYACTYVGNCNGCWAFRIQDFSSDSI